MSCQGKWLVGVAEHSLQSLAYPFQMKALGPDIKLVFGAARMREALGELAVCMEECSVMACLF